MAVYETHGQSFVTMGWQSAPVNEGVIRLQRPATPTTDPSTSNTTTNKTGSVTSGSSRKPTIRGRR